MCVPIKGHSFLEKIVKNTCTHQQQVLVPKWNLKSPQICSKTSYKNDSHFRRHIGALKFCQILLSSTIVNPYRHENFVVDVHRFFLTIFSKKCPLMGAHTPQHTWLTCYVQKVTVFEGFCSKKDYLSSFYRKRSSNPVCKSLNWNKNDRDIFLFYFFTIYSKKCPGHFLE